MLTEKQIREAKADEGGKVRFLPDPDVTGLRLRIQPAPSGAKSWQWRGTVRGKRVDRGLGPWPAVSAAEARAAAKKLQDEAQRTRAPKGLGIEAPEAMGAILAEAMAPVLAQLQAMQQTQAALVAELTALRQQPSRPTPEAASGQTFEAVALAKVALQAEGWRESTEAKNRAELADNVLPALGDMDVAAVGPAEAAECLRPIWGTAPSVAKRCLSRIVVTIKHAKALGLRADSLQPDDVRERLPSHKANGTKHRDSIPHAQVAAALAKVDASKATPHIKALAAFVALTACRTSEARLADWGEIDLGARLWNVPAEHAKQGTAHQVPLSKQAVKLLKSRGPRDSGPVFANRKGKGVSPAAVRNLFYRLGLGGSVHGLRTSFRVWAAENEYSRELAELSLSHKFGSAVEQAYQRSTLLAQRRPMMQAWADYLES